MTTVKIRTAFLSVAAVIIVAIFLLFLGSDNFYTPRQHEVVQLDDGWTISRGLNKWESDNLPNESIGIVNKDDVVILTRTLPEEDIYPATIYFKSILSSIKVYLDGELIYTFGDDFVEKGLMLPKMENFIQLPQDFQGKELTIELTAHENNAFAGLSPVKLGIYNDIKNELVQTKRLNLVIGVYLCHLGFLLMILSPFLAFSQFHDFSIFFSSLTSLLMGIYILCYNDHFWYLSDNPDFYTFTEYFSLYLIPAAILGFVIAAGQSVYKRTGITLMVINLVFGLGTTLLHLFNIVHICKFVSWLHVIGLLEGIFVIISLIVSAIKGSKAKGEARKEITSTQTLITGLIIFLICALIDIVSFNVLKFTQNGEVNANINFMTFGALVFIMTLLLNFFYHCIEYINESTVKTQLEGLAYSDALTGISNRSRCEQVLAELSGSFTIISMDLDYLKYTNDNYGHDQGDKLLSGFSEILRNSFTDASLIGRMGGDEFIIVLPFIDEERTQRDLRGFTDLMEHRNSQESKLRFSASWGYAASNEKEVKNSLSAQKVYLLADQRMYTMKNQHHKQTLGRLYEDLLGKMTNKGGADNE